MTSIEIAELVSANHADARRSIERLAESEVISLPPLAEVVIATRSSETVCRPLPRMRSWGSGAIASRAVVDP
ncbi:hypothetical protein D3C81_1609790 [compost metagenome]